MLFDGKPIMLKWINFISGEKEDCFNKVGGVIKVLMKTLHHKGKQKNWLTITLGNALNNCFCSRLESDKPCAASRYLWHLQLGDGPGIVCGVDAECQLWPFIEKIGFGCGYLWICISPIMEMSDFQAGSHLGTDQTQASSATLQLLSHPATAGTMLWSDSPATSRLDCCHRRLPLKVFEYHHLVHC